jgi:hypothetical protein
MSRQFQNSQQTATGKVVSVVKPELTNSGDFIDEFDALSAEWNRPRVKSATLSPKISKPKSTNEDRFVSVRSSEINFNDYLPPVVITCGSLNIR